MPTEFISEEEYKRKNTPPPIYVKHIEEATGSKLNESETESVQITLKLIESLKSVPHIEELDKVTPTYFAHLLTYNIMVNNKHMAIINDTIGRSPQVIMDRLFKRVFKALELLTACKPEAAILMKGYMKELEATVGERKKKKVTITKEEQALIDFEKSLTKEEYNQSEAAPLLKTTRKSLNAWKDEIDFTFAASRPKISKVEMVRLYKLKVLKIK